MPEPESVRTMRGIIFGLAFSIGALWIPLAGVVIAETLWSR